MLLDEATQKYAVSARALINEGKEILEAEHNRAINICLARLKIAEYVSDPVTAISIIITVRDLTFTERGEFFNTLYLDDIARLVSVKLYGAVRKLKNGDYTQFLKSL